MLITVRVLILTSFLYALVNAEEAKGENFEISHPEWYIKINDFNVYSARGVAVIHHVAIQNTSDIAYESIKVRVRYNSASYPNYGVGVCH